MSAIKPLGELDLVPGLVAELPKYLALANNALVFDVTKVDIYTEAILSWWRNHAKELPKWAKAARIMFAFSPNSASCASVSSRC